MELKYYIFLFLSFLVPAYILHSRQVPHSPHPGPGPGTKARDHAYDLSADRSVGSCLVQDVDGLAVLMSSHMFLYLPSRVDGSYSQADLGLSSW